jgi:CRISPR/Cas system-associated exonuclease Cas4 (RecB family)
VVSTISKSKYMNGLQCQRLLWLSVNQPEAIPPVDEETQFIFDQGHEVGNFAKMLFPEGIEVPHDSDMVKKTHELIDQRKTIFEASLSHNKTFAKPDILKPVGKEEWDLIEVKSSTQVKDEHIDDIAFQRYVLEGNGLRIRRCEEIFINNEYVRNGEIDPANLLKQEDVTELISQQLPLVESNVKEMHRILSLEKPPEVSIGSHCSDPQSCPLKEECWAFLPEHNVTELYSFKKKFDLVGKGILRIADLPASVKLSDKQRIQKESITKGEPIIKKKEIKEFLNGLEYPVYCLDFETLNVAIPPLSGTRPYQKIPFQFSLHVIKKPRGEVEFHEFLADGGENFAPDLVEALKVIGPKGTVLAYNMSFEKQVLQALETLSFENANWLQGIADRMQDLIAPFRSFSYYHPDQHGSCSLKSVLPCFSEGRSYNDMEISEGGMASIRYYTTHFKECSKEEREKARKDLLEYCKLDTEGMVDILNAFEEM